MKVKELAQELGLDAAELKEMLVDMGISIKTVASTLDPETVTTIRQTVKEVIAETKPKAPPKPVAAPPSAAQTTYRPSASMPQRPGMGKKPAALAERTDKVDTRKKHKKDKSRLDIEEVVEEEDALSTVLPPPGEGEAGAPAIPEGINEIVLSGNTISLRDLADQLQVHASDIIKALIADNMLLTINQIVDIDLARKIGEKFNIKVSAPEKKADTRGELERLAIKDTKPATGSTKRRPPVITIMGHVDHGKTKLLDTIRNTNVMATEAGGITQHIGAYQVNVHGKSITFLDTPGHAAFTALRARGAQVTDIVVLVVAADDGVMPQTKEAIDHAKLAKVPIVVAINKIDKPDADPEKVKKQLTEFGLVCEEWGGDTVMVPISAKANKGIDELLEMLLLVAELKDLKATYEGPAQGVIIEARLSRKRGPVATVLVQQGTLSKGDAYVIGTTYGRIRAMFNDQGVEVKKAGPSMPVEILGISEVPNSGDLFQVVDNEKLGRLIAEERSVAKGGTAQQRSQVSLESFSKEVSGGRKKELNLIIKADVQGSLEAISKALQDIKVKNIQVQLIHTATGVVNESDIVLAKASEAIIIGFNVTMNNEAQQLAEKEGVSVRMYNIIYKAIEDIELAMEGMLEPEFEEVNLGTLEVRDTFSSSKIGTIAGCFVIEGKVQRNVSARVFRNKEKVYEGKISGLKRFKDDAKEVLKGFECGISFDDFDQIQKGDIIKVFEVREKPRVKRAKE
jgi:translation initiation factor IF-2